MVAFLKVKSSNLIGTGWLGRMRELEATDPDCNGFGSSGHHSDTAVPTGLTALTAV